MNLKYRIKFNITNLDVQELRDFKINLINSNNILEFDCDSPPRLPSKSDRIRIAGRIFEITTSESEYIIENEEVLNIFNFNIVDVVKKSKDEEDARSKLVMDKIRGMSSKYKTYDYDRGSIPNIDINDYNDYFSETWSGIKSK